MRRYFALVFLFLSSAVVWAGFIEEDKKPVESVQADGVSEADWPQHMHDARRSGSFPLDILPPYKLLWEKTNLPMSQRLQAVIAYGKVFLPSINGKVYALDAKSGKELWVRECGSDYLEGFLNSAAVDDGRVFAASLNGFVYALSVEDGEILWKTKILGKPRVAPTVAKGKVFLGSPEGVFYALNAKSGDILWQTEVGAPILDTAAYYDGVIGFASEDVRFHGLDAETGSKLWVSDGYGRGARDRHTVAGKGKFVFCTMPKGGGPDLLANGTSVTKEVAGQGWKANRKAIEEYFREHPQHQTFFVRDVKTGKSDYIAPVLFTSGGSSPHTAPVIDEKGNCYVVYRMGELGGFQTFGMTTQYALYLGLMNLETGDIQRLDTWGVVPPKDHDPKQALRPDYSKKMLLISDESHSMCKIGGSIAVAKSGGAYFFDLDKKRTYGLLKFLGSSKGGMPGTDIVGSAPILAPSFFHGDIRKEIKEAIKLGKEMPMMDRMSDKNDLQRSPSAARGVIYQIMGDTIMAVAGGEQ